MENRHKDLKDFQIEILSKFYTALDQIPLPVLEKFPQFNARSFQELKILYQHVKAKIRLVETKLAHIKIDENKKVADKELSDVTNNFPLFKTSETLNQQSVISISDNDSFNASNTNLSDAESSCTAKTQTTLSTVKEFPNFLQKKGESQIKDQKNSIDLQSSEKIKSDDSPVQGKKSTFELKRPIKATGSELSKQIGEIWKKEEGSKVTNTKTKVSNLNANSSFDNTYNVEKVQISESACPEWKERENFQIPEKLGCENKPADWNVKDVPYMKGRFNTLYLYVYMYQFSTYMIIYLLQTKFHFLKR